MKVKIAIVNSSTFGVHFKEHLEILNEFAVLSEVKVPVDIDGASLAKATGDVDGIIAGVNPHFGGDFMQLVPSLKIICRHGIGCNNVDITTATELGIRVSRVDGPVERDSVAEHAVGLMLAVAREIHKGYDAVRESRWADRASMIGFELRGKRIGIIGLGNIGSRVAEILHLGFNSEVVVSDPRLTSSDISALGYKPLGLDELISTSDVISFHCPLTPESTRMLNAERLSRTKRGVVIINTCRGELLDESALIDALRSAQVRAYGSDVVEGEPVSGDHRLVKAPNVLIVPHLGGYSVESLRGMGQTMVDDMKRFFVEDREPGILANPGISGRPRRA